MRKPKLVITASGLLELQERILAQYYGGNKLYKYNNVMSQYSELVKDGEAIHGSAPPKTEYVLAV